MAEPDVNAMLSALLRDPNEAGAGYESTSELGSDPGGITDEGNDTLLVAPTYNLDMEKIVHTGPGGRPDRSGLRVPAPAEGRRPQVKTDLSTTLYFSEIRMVFSARADGTTAFWDIKSERQRQHTHLLRTHKGPVTCLLAFSKQSESEVAQSLLLTGSADFTVKVWDPMRVKEPGGNKGAPCIQTLAGHGGTVTQLARVGDYVFTGSTDRKLLMYRASMGREAVLYPWFECLSGEDGWRTAQRTLAVMDGWIASLHFAVTQKVGDLGALFAADSTGAVAKFKVNVAEGQLLGDRRFLDYVPVNNAGKVSGSTPPPLLFRKPVSGKGLTHVRYLAEWGLVVTLCYDNKLRIYDEKSITLKKTVENPHDCLFTDCTYNDVHSQLMMIDKHGFLFVYDVKKDAMILIHRLLHEPLLSICYNEDADEVGIVLKGKILWWRFIRDAVYSTVPDGHSGPVITVQMVAPGADGMGYMFSCALDNTVRVWDPYDMMCLRVLTETREELSAMCYCEHKRVLVTGHARGTVRLWNLDTSSTINMKHHGNTVSCIITARLRKNETFVLTGSFDGKVGIWEVRKRFGSRPHLVTMFDAHPTSEVLCLLHDSFKDTIITAGNDMVIKVWHGMTHELVGQHVGHTEAVGCLALDANFLFSGSEDCTIRVWDSISKPPPNVSATPSRSARTFIKALEGHERPVTALQMLDETGHLLSTSLDGTLRVWDYTAGLVLQQFTHAEEMRCMTYRLDTNEVLVGTTDDNIIKYPLPDECRQSVRASRAASAVAPDEEDEQDDEDEEVDDLEAAYAEAVAASAAEQG